MRPLLKIYQFTSWAEICLWLLLASLIYVSLWVGEGRSLWNHIQMHIRFASLTLKVIVRRSCSRLLLWRNIGLCQNRSSDWVPFYRISFRSLPCSVIALPLRYQIAIASTSASNNLHLHNRVAIFIVIFILHSVSLIPNSNYVFEMLTFRALTLVELKIFVTYLLISFWL